MLGYAPFILVSAKYDRTLEEDLFCVWLVHPAIRTIEAINPISSILRLIVSHTQLTFVCYVFKV